MSVDQNEKQISVLILTDGMPAGGTERQVVELLKGLHHSSKRIRTFFGTLVKGGAREKEAYYWADVVVPVRQSHRLDFTLAYSLSKFINKYQIDIIHTLGSVSDLCGVIAAKFSQVKVVNGSIRNARKNLNIRDRLSKFAMIYADQIVANSNAGLCAYGKQNQRNAKVIYNGVDFRRFDNVTPFHSARPYVCMVGNFNRKKDHKALIRAFPAILSKFPNYNLVLVGKGELEHSCRQVVEELQIVDKVIFINNCVAPEPYIKGAEVCILLSTDGEGLSNVLLEYCSLSKPVIASSRGGNKEIIIHGKTGLLIDSHSEKEVSSSITDLLTDENKSFDYGAAGRKYVLEKFGVERMIAEYESLYVELIN